jgi:hypothetical protein
MELAADAVVASLWSPADAPFDALPDRFGYRLKPAAAR